MSGKSLQAIFGGEQIGDKVKNYQFTPGNANIEIGFAPAYGGLNKDVLDKLDSNTKLMIVGVVKSLEKLRSDERTFDSVLASMMQNPLLAPVESRNIHRSDTYLIESSDAFSNDVGPDSAIVQQVNQWFVRLIGNENILRTTQIDANMLARIVKQAGTARDSSGHRDENRESVFSLTYLQFPDLDNLYFQVCRIVLRTWSPSERMGFNQSDQNGISGEINAKGFGPRTEVMAGLSDSARGRAMESMSNFFG